MLLLCLSLGLTSCGKENSVPKESPTVTNSQSINWNTSSIEFDDLDFGVVEDTASKILTINVINDSTEILTGVPHLSNTNFSIVVSNCQDLAPGKSCVIKLYFDSRNKLDNLYTANISFGSALSLVQAEIIRPQPVQDLAFFNRTAQLSSLNIGTINYNNSLIKSITIKNLGNTTINDVLSLSNNNFSIIYDTCSNRNLAPNKNCQFKFFMTGRGKSGIVNADITYGNKTLTLTTTVKPFDTVAEENSEIVLLYNNVNHNQTPIDLGTLNLGTYSDFKFIYKNTGTGAGRISSINLDSVLQIVQNNCSGQIIYPNETCTVRTKLLSQAKGTFNTLISSDIEYGVNSQSIQWLVRSPGDKILCTSQIDNAQVANVTWSGSVYSNCEIESCLTGYHIQDNTCLINIENCSVDNGTGTKTWNTTLGEFDQCYVDQCDAGYNNTDHASCDYIQPIAQNNSFILDEDSSLENQDLSVQTNGISPGVASQVLAPEHGTLIITNNKFSYTPNPNYNGTDSFTYRVFDGQVYSPPATIGLTITAVNDTPVAVAQSLTTLEDTALNITLTGTDIEGSALSYTVITQPTHGVITGTVPNLIYTPTTNYFGPDSLTFKVNDGTVNSNTATMSLTITSVNDLPSVSSSDFSTPVNTNYASLISGTDTEGSALTYSIVTNPTKGTISGLNSSSGTFTYIPTTNAFGSDSFVVRSFDGTDYSVNKTVNISISTTRPCSADGGSGTQTFNTSSNVWGSCILATCPVDKVKTSDNLECVYKIASGGTITTSGNYRIHTFNSSSTFVVSAQAATSGYEVLIVGGGGGGGNGIYYAANGGGGGGGGVIQGTMQLTSTSFPVTVGAAVGGNTQGNNSSFNGTVAFGGGRGGSSAVAGPAVGGSGGGGNSNVGGAAGTAGQGKAGGSASGATWGGGGGGAGQVGNANGQSYGGNGITSSISGSTVWYGGGGGAGNDYIYAPGGNGGGGTGVPYFAGGGGGSGASNTGGGGGGGASRTPSVPAGGGGSGVIIIRYLYK